MRNLFRKVSTLVKSGEPLKAVKLLEDAELKGPIHPKIPLLKALCILETDDNNEYSLKDAENSLKKALSIDDEYEEALFELGCFYYAINNDSKKAIPLFEKAINLYKEKLTEAVIYLAESLSEVKTYKEGIKYLEYMKIHALDIKEINDTIKEFKEY